MNKIGLIIQGPTTYYKDITPWIKNIENLVWSTWVDEDTFALKKLEEEGIIVICDEKPINSGYWNTNYQCQSTLNGIRYFKERHFEKVVKIRSDLRIDNYLEFQLACEKALENNKIFSLGYNYTFVNKELKIYMLDFIIGGEINEMELFFSYNVSFYNGEPTPELWFIKNYFGNENYIKLKLSILLKKGFFLDATNFNFQWLKYNYTIPKIQKNKQMIYANQFSYINHHKNKIVNYIKKFAKSIIGYK